MTSRYSSFRLVASASLVLAVAGCGAPLSENWAGYRLGQIKEEAAAPQGQLQPEAEMEPARVAPDCSAVKCVALTFDDGPGKYTPELLELLDEYEAKATFFLIGENVKKHPQIARDELARGHEIGNHTWAHKDLRKMSAAAVKRDLAKTDALIEETTGEKATLARPPFGAIPQSLAKTLPVPVILWNVDTLDWKTRDTKSTIKIAETTTPGSIVLMHDIHESTVAAMPSILKDLKSRDYHFVTVTELVGDPKPGTLYGTGQRPVEKK